MRGVRALRVEGLGCRCFWVEGFRTGVQGCQGCTVFRV